MARSINGSVGYLILQVLRDTGHIRTSHMFERETGMYFDVEYFELAVLSGSWIEAENYLAGFTKLGDNKLSTIMYFELRKTAFIEAIHKHDLNLASAILLQGLQIFQRGNEALYDNLLKLLLMASRRTPLSGVELQRRIKSDREGLMARVKPSIISNPIFKGKLVFPRVDRGIINRFMDGLSHNNDDQAANVSSLPAQAISFPDVVISPDCLSSSNAAPGGANSAPPRLANYGTLTKAYAPLKDVRAPFADPGQSGMAIHIPRSLTQTLNMGTQPTSMDFHPLDSCLLLVGTCVGNIGLWDVSSAELLNFRTFTLWDVECFSSELQIDLAQNVSEDSEDIPPQNPDGTKCELEYQNMSINRIVWSPDGSLFGVAYSKNIVQLFSYLGGSDIQKKIEAEAHKGSVNDIAFSSHSGQLLFITCGDDKKIKVWNVKTGARKFLFEVHEAPVYSVCPRTREGSDYIYSVSLDGKLEASFYVPKQRVNYKSPVLGRAKMIVSTDGLRLFSCGTNTDGDSFLVEWNENNGTVKRVYQGLNQRQHSVVQFDRSKNLLAAGDDHLIKFWDINRDQPLGALALDGDLPVTPRICFSKEGALLAVEADEARIKILATNQGIGLLSKLKEARKRNGTARMGNLGKRKSNSSSNGASNSPEVDGDGDDDDDTDGDHASENVESLKSDAGGKRRKLL